jgi:DNA mismatch repair protein MutS2
MNLRGDNPLTQDLFSREVLEFGSVIELLRAYLSGPISEPLLESLEPHTRLDVIQRDLERVRNAREFLRETPRPGLNSLKDPRGMIEKLRVEGASLTALEIYALVEVARVARDIRSLFAKGPVNTLAELGRSLPDLRSLVEDLHGKILPDGSVDSSASPELRRIRHFIEKLKAEIQVALERMLVRLSRDQILQDAVVTIRNDRFVIPVRAEEKRRVQGVVHGASSSGATVYVEPLETLQLNNELVELQDREFAEVQRILGELSEKLRERRLDLENATEILSEIDLAFAKAEFSRQYDCCIPEFVRERALLLRKVRHPLLEKTLRARGQNPTPLTIEIREPKTLMIISGPNTGGKTVALKTVGISVLMAQAGLPVAASEARLPNFGKVLADIGDLQSIEANLSSFSAHVTTIQSMVRVAASNDLVLLDELGASTEPNEGAALAVAILDHFRQVGAVTLVSTHHSRLKAYAAETLEAVNAAMEFDETTLQPTYRLLIGLPGKSGALDVAKRLGLEPSIVEKARAMLHPADAEAATLIAGLHAQKVEFERQVGLLEERRKELEARYSEMEKSFEQERRAKLKDLDTRLEHTLRENEKRWESTLEQLRAQLQAYKSTKSIDRRAASLKREVREEWNAQVLAALGSPAEAAAGDSAASAPLAVGDCVRLPSLPTPGTVKGLAADGMVEVEIGRLHLRVRRDEVRVLSRGASSAQAPKVVVDRPQEAPAEVNVIGMTAEEACDLVDKFLDQAFVAGRFRLRVVHGHGKGILRRTLHEMFSSHPHVEKFYAAPAHEGGTGATIVEIKV